LIFAVDFFDNQLYMDNLLYLLLGVFVLLIIFCLYRSGAIGSYYANTKQAIQERMHNMEMEMDLDLKAKMDGGESEKPEIVAEKKSILTNLMEGNFSELIGQSDGQTAAAPLPQIDSDASIPDLGQGAPSQSMGSIEYPFENQNMGYPSGILPGQVGTFHPTKNCDRFTCNGCDMCTDDGPVGPRTDDHDRNYPELIDKIRISRTCDFPHYNMS
jgi:hypothetical protein